MSNSPNMAYCANRNTADALNQVLDLMEQYDTPTEWYNDLSIDEQHAARALSEATDSFQMFFGDVDY